MTTTSVPLHTLGAGESAALIASGALSPLDLLDAVLRRIAAVDSKIGAWAYLDADGARAEAAAMTNEAAAGRLRGPLHGVPVGIKDVFDVRGMPTISNSHATPVTPVDQDSAIARRLRQAGAILVGKTTTVEFAGLGDPPETRNPWNLAHTPGGSSSGSGAAVGARMVPIAIGTQTGGSNLRPAAYNGVTGYKGSYGRIARTGCIALAYSLDHPGIIARSMADCALAFSVLAGRDPSDPTTLDLPAPAAVIEEIAPPRLGLVRDFFLDRAEPEMRVAVEDRAAEFARAGAAIREVRLPSSFSLHRSGHRIVMAVEGAVSHARRYSERAADFRPKHLTSFQANSLIPATYYLQAQRIRQLLFEELQALFADVDALIMPTAPGPAPEGIASTGDASFLSPWSFVGYPAASISAGLSAAGMPMGLQIVGRPRGDDGLLKVAAWCEGVVGTLPPPLDFP